MGSVQYLYAKQIWKKLRKYFVLLFSWENRDFPNVVAPPFVKTLFHEIKTGRINKHVKVTESILWNILLNLFNSIIVLF